MFIVLLTVGSGGAAAVGMALTELEMDSGAFSFLLTTGSFGILLLVNKLSVLTSISFFSRLVGLSVKLLDDEDGGEYGG